MRGFIRIFLCAACFLVFPALSFAQGDLGALTGSILDPSGAVVAEATITITEVNTGAHWSLKSSSAGYYRLPVPPGTYRVEAEMQGFKKALADNIVVPVAQVVTIDMHLQVGTTSQSVTVTSEAPLLTTSTAEVGASLTPEEFQTLPVFISDGGRQPDTFIWNSLPGTTADWAGEYGSINGGQGGSQSVLIDGVTIGRFDWGSDLGEQNAGVDAISEFKVQEANYSAEYGTTGGGIENFTIKSGTNQFHGSADEYNNNPIWDANGWENNAVGAGKYDDKENNFSATLGGPIKRNKAFFFFDYEGDRKAIFGVTGLTSVPTANMLKGDFSDFLYACNPLNSGCTLAAPGVNSAPTQVGTDALGRPVDEWEMYDPTTTRLVAAGATDPVTGLVNNSGAAAVIRDPFPGNQIPATEFSKATSTLLSRFPSNYVNNRLFSNEAALGATCCPVMDRNAETAKIDVDISAKQKLSGSLTEAVRHRQMKDNTYGAWQPWFTGFPLNREKIQSVGGPQLRILYTLTVNDHTVNTLSFGYNRFGNGNGQSPDASYTAAMGIPGISDVCFPVMNMSDSDGISFLNKMSVGCPSRDPVESFSYQDVYAITRGKHSLKFGGQLLHYRYDTYEPGSPSFSFSNQQTGLPGFYSNTGSAFASWLMGAATAGSAQEFTTEPGYRSGLFAFFAQDDWRATSKLTLSLGVRWEIPQPLTEAFNRISQFDPTATDTMPSGATLPGAIVWLGSCSTCIHRSSFQDRYYRDLAPRFGLAYQITPKLVFRGGYGISYQPPTYNGWGARSLIGFNQGYAAFRASGELAAANPVLYLSNLVGAALPPGTQLGLPPFTGTLPNENPSIMNGYEPDFYPAHSLDMPLVQNWSAGFQRELRGKILLEANYVGSRGTRLFNKDFNADWNQANSKYMGLGDMLVDDFQTDLSNPATAAILKQYGITQLPYPTFEQDNWSANIGPGLALFPQYSGLFNDQTNMGMSIYHSLQVQARKNSTHGLTFIAAYTLSKDISDSDSVMYNSVSSIQDFYNRKLERSIVGFDYPQVLKLTWIYSLPFGSGQRWLNSSHGLNRLVGGWQVAASQRYGSGDPLSISSAVAGTAITPYVRPDVVAGVKETVPLHGLDAINGTPYLNNYAFQEPGGGRIYPVSSPTPGLSPINDFALSVGTAPRYLPSVRGPAHQEEDFSILKNVPITERVKFQLRAEFENVFNRVGRGDPDTTFDDGTFGLIFGPMNGPRLIQIGGHLTF